MKKQSPLDSAYKTEEQLKAEAKQRADEQARRETENPPPSPGKKKAENFWYHYKWHTLGVGAAILLVMFFVHDLLLRTNPDATIILAVSTPVSEQSLDTLQAELEALAWDFNGDEEVVIQLDYIYLSPSAGGQQEYASTAKLTTSIMAGVDPLYLLDDALYDHLTQGSAPDADTETEATKGGGASRIFAPLPFPAAINDRLPFSATLPAENPDCAPFAESAFSLRPAGTGERSEEYYAYCLQLIQAITETEVAAVS